MKTTEKIELVVGDGTTMFADVAHPTNATGPGPGIIVLQDGFGVTQFLRDTAVRFADLGFTAIAPDLYHRTGHGIEMSYDDEQTAIHCDAHKSIHHNTDGMIADGKAAFVWLSSQPGVAPDRIAAIGFCLGGRAAFLLNAHLPLPAAISFYGGKIAPDLLHEAPKQHGTLLMFWGGSDPFVPQRHNRAVEDALTAAGARHEQVTFSEASHGFFCPARRNFYHEGSARLAWTLSLELLRVTGVLEAPVLATA